MVGKCNEEVQQYRQAMANESAGPPWPIYQTLGSIARAAIGQWSLVATCSPLILGDSFDYRLGIKIPEHRRNDSFKCFMYLTNLDTNTISKMQGMRQGTKFCFRREANNKALCRIVQFCRAYLLKIEPSHRTNSGQADTACGADQSPEGYAKSREG